MKFLYLALGGSLGTILRYLTYVFFSKREITSFPWGSLTVNLVGSFLIGIAFALLSKSGIPLGVRLFLFVGFFGSFTTFSTFSLDTINLINEGQIKIALLYILGSNILGISLCYSGIFLGELMINK